MNIIKKITIMLVLGIYPASALAVLSAESTSISVNPSVYVFQEVAANSQSSTVAVTVKNVGASDLTIGTLSLSGDHGDQYEITADACSGNVVVASSQCIVSVRYSPTARGHKQALLNIPSNSSDTPILQAFLTSREDVYNQSSRRLPPVLYDVDIPETMASGTTYNLTWSILGYHESYTSLLVMFDCTGIVDNSCGDSYGDSTRFFTSLDVGPVIPIETVSAPWTNGTVNSKEFKFTVPFTPSFNQDTDIVVRFYRKNSADLSAGKGSLSLVIPGKNAAEYYDTEGRRIKKTILATP